MADSRQNDIACRPVNFDDYEAGYKELANEIYDYLPEEEREAALLIFIRTMLLY